MPMPTIAPERLARYEAQYAAVMRDPPPYLCPFLANPRLLANARACALATWWLEDEVMLLHPLTRAERDQLAYALGHRSVGGDPWTAAQALLAEYRANWN